MARMKKLEEATLLGVLALALLMGVSSCDRRPPFVCSADSDAYRMLASQHDVWYQTVVDMGPRLEFSTHGFLVEDIGLVSIWDTSGWLDYDDLGRKPSMVVLQTSESWESDGRPHGMYGYIYAPDFHPSVVTSRWSVPVYAYAELAGDIFCFEAIPWPEDR